MLKHSGLLNIISASALALATLLLLKRATEAMPDLEMAAPSYGPALAIMEIDECEFW